MTIRKERLLATAEDIEYFKKWWENDESVDNTMLRHGSSVLRRLLVENAVGRSWRALGLRKEPTMTGPDPISDFQAKMISIKQNIATVSLALGRLVRQSDQNQGVRSA